MSLPTSQVFEIWRMIYDKSYPSLQEKLYRFAVFEMNLDKIIKDNKSTSTCCWGLNEFGDLTKDELMKAYGLDVPPVFTTPYVHNFFLLIVVHFLNSFTHTYIHTQLFMLML